MGRSSGLGGIIEGVTGKGGTLTGRATGIPMPIAPIENVGIMSGSMRKKREGKRRDERGSKRIAKVRPENARPFEPDLISPKPPGPHERPVPRPRKRINPIERRRKPRFDPTKPSAVMETTRVNVQDPTLGGPPEREVPIPKEKDTSPRGPAPFSPDERAMARDAFFEKMFSRADERKQSKAMDQEERRNVSDARRDEAAMRGGERGMRDERGGRRRRGRRMRRRDFTRKRSKMEGRRSREERAAFRDRYVSTLR